MPRPNAPLFELGAGCYIVSPDGRLLLVEQERDGVRDWGCVGGGMEQGETIEECAVREAFEETGLRVRLVRLLTVSEFSTVEGRHVVGFLFLAEPAPWPQGVVLPEMDGKLASTTTAGAPARILRRSMSRRRSCASTCGRWTSKRRF